MTAEDFDDGTDTAVHVWPDNLPAVNVMVAMATQWRTTGYGSTGLDYSVLPSVFELTGVPKADWPDTFECVRVMEGEALKLMNKDR